MSALKAKRKRSLEPESNPAAIPNHVYAQALTRPRTTASLEALREFVGPDPTDAALHTLLEQAKGDLEAAVKAFYDASEQVISSSPSSATGSAPATQPSQPTAAPPSTQARPVTPRYMGDMLVVGYATAKVSLSRRDLATPMQVNVDNTRRGRPMIRITMVSDPRMGPRGRDIARITSEEAAWIGLLITGEAITFEANIINPFGVSYFSLNIGDTVHLNLQALAHLSFFSLPNPRIPAPRHAVGSLLSHCNIRPQIRGSIIADAPVYANFSSTAMGTSRGEGEEALVIEEAPEVVSSSRGEAHAEPGEGAPSEEELMNPELLAQVYEKSTEQTFYLPETQEGPNVSLSLRSYQRQALTWLLRRELAGDAAVDVGTRKSTINPLWEGYPLPTSTPAGGDLIPPLTLYVHPFTGTTSLEFPSEDQSIRGGILADEMGLGKTIEMLALIHANPHPSVPGPVFPSRDESPTPSADEEKEEEEEDQEDEEEEETAADSADDAYAPHEADPDSVTTPRTTLVVCPMSLLAQWRDECIAGSLPGSMRVSTYYGQERNAGRLADLLSNPHTAPDIMITTYGTVMAEYLALANRSGTHKGLFSVKYWRIILDEAHIIKNPLGKTSQACYALQSERRWTLTGTPILNQPDDIYSLLRFIGHSPWSQREFWRQYVSLPFLQKDPQAMHALQNALSDIILRRMKTSLGLDGQPLVSLPPRTINIRRLALNPHETALYQMLKKDSLTRFQRMVDNGTAMRKFSTILEYILRLRQACDHPSMVLNSDKAVTMLQRPRTPPPALSSAPPVDVFRAHKEKQWQSQLDRMISKHVTSGDTFVQERLAQVILPIELSEEGGGEECPVCLEEGLETVWLPCLHSLCQGCFTGFLDLWESTGESGKCPVCRSGPVTLDSVIRRPPPRPPSPFEIPPDAEIPEVVDLSEPTDPTSSSKVAALIDDLEGMVEGGEEEKAVVFSQFVQFLDLLAQACDEAGITWCRLDGKMSQREREVALEKFRSPSGPRVILMSLRTGGVGLNLTVASRVFLMEPWWNWSVEAQAIDRIHRLGQTREVHVTRFIIEDSIEERMLALQGQKESMTDVALGGSSTAGTTNRAACEEEKRARRLMELKFLFGNDSS